MCCGNQLRGSIINYYCFEWGFYKILNSLINLYLFYFLFVRYVWMGHQSSLVFFGDDIEELLVVDDAVLVGVGGLDHGLDLLPAEVLADPFADLVELVDAEALLAAAELGEQLLAGGLALLLGGEAEHLQEGGEVDGLGLGVLLDDLQHLVGLLLNA